MNHAALPGMVQGLAQLFQIEEGFFGIEPTFAVKQGPKGLPFDIFKCNEVEALVFATEKDPDNMLVIQLGRAAGLLMEALHRVRVVGGFRGQDF